MAKRWKLRLALGLGVLVAAGGATAAVVTRGTTLGRVAPAPVGLGVVENGAAAVAANPTPVELGTINPYVVNGEDFSIAGVGMRNQKTATIQIAGAGPATRAFVWIAYTNKGAPPDAQLTLRIQRLWPLGNGSNAAAKPAQNVRLRLLGSDLACWAGGTSVDVYRGSVSAGAYPTSRVVVGNGTYLVTIPDSAAGSFDGASPFNGTASFPLLDGVTIASFFKAPGNTLLFDANLSDPSAPRVAGHRSPDSSQNHWGFHYTLNTGPLGNFGTEFAEIGADGQRGFGISTLQDLENEPTIVNGVPIAGAGSVLGDGNWDGSSGNPLTQLWDTNEYDIYGVKGNSLDVTTATPNGPLSKDCVVTVANLVHTR